MAEREGFEPSEELSPLTRLAGERLRPARQSLRRNVKFSPNTAKNFNPKKCTICTTLLHQQLDVLVAEGVGFEPTSRFRETVFKTAAFSHSAIPPHSYLAYFIAC